MSDSAQLVIAVVTAGLPTLIVLISLLINIQRLGNLSRQMDLRFDEHRELFRSELLRVEQVMDARLRHLEEYLTR